MPITTPAQVRTPEQIAATRIQGIAEARCATCTYLLVELPRPIRLPIPRPGADPLMVYLTHAHTAADECTGCYGAEPGEPRPCAADHDPAPCPAAEPVPCDNGECDLPAGVLSDHCALCGYQD